MNLRRKSRRRFVRSCALPAVLAVAALLGATAAHATPPTQVTITPPPVTVEDQAACGDFGISWHITATITRQRFTDGEGNVTFVLLHIKEHNTLTNLTTGKTVSDDPVYEQVAHFDADGNLLRVDTMGLWVNAREGGDSITDVGRVSFAVVPDGSWVMVFAAGQHPFREVSQGDLQQGLAAFCDLVS